MEYKLNGYPIHYRDVIGILDVEDDQSKLIELFKNGKVEIDGATGDNTIDILTINDSTFKHYNLPEMFKDDEEMIRTLQSDLNTINRLIVDLMINVNTYTGMRFTENEILKSNHGQIFLDMQLKIRRKLDTDRLSKMTNEELRHEIKEQLLENFKFGFIRLVKRDLARVYDVYEGAGRSTINEIIKEGTIDEVLDYVIADNDLNMRLRKSSL